MGRPTCGAVCLRRVQGSVPRSHRVSSWVHGIRSHSYTHSVVAQPAVPFAAPRFLNRAVCLALPAREMDESCSEHVPPVPHQDVREGPGPSSPTTDEESHGRRMRDTEERETRVAKRQCLAAPSISPSPSISPPPPGDSCPLTVISGDRQTFYADRPMICAASTFIRNTLSDTHCEVLNLPPWLQVLTCPTLAPKLGQARLTSAYLG